MLNGDMGPTDSLSAEAYERRIERLECEKLELSRKLQESSKILQNSFHGGNEERSDEETVRLRDEVNILRKRLAGEQSMLLVSIC